MGLLRSSLGLCVWDLCKGRLRDHDRGQTWEKLSRCTISLILLVCFLPHYPVPAHCQEGAVVKGGWAGKGSLQSLSDRQIK